METITALPTSNGMSAADIKALVGNDNNGIFGGQGGGVAALLLFLLLGGQSGFGNNGNNSDAVLRAIDGSDADTRYLGQILNTDITAIQSGLCDIKTGIATQTGAIVSSSKDVQNAIQTGLLSMSKDQAACCCQILRAQDAALLDNCKQTNTITGAITQNRFDSQMGFTNLGNTFREGLIDVENKMSTGFNQNAFAIQGQTNTLENAIQREGAATRELIRDTRFQDTRDENAALKLQISQANQTAAILTACGCCPDSKKPVAQG